MAFNRDIVGQPGWDDLAENLQPRLEVEEYFRLSGGTFRKSKRRLWFNRSIKTPLLKLAFKTAGVYGSGVRNALSLIVRTATLSFPELPLALDGFTILHISDLHIDGMDGLAEAMAKIVAPLRPDLCVLTGDYRFEIDGACTAVYPRMAKVAASISARCGIVSILGNHDAAEMAYRLQDMGVRMLINDALEIHKDGASLWLAGVDDQFDYRCANLPKALLNVPGEAFKILLAHDPQLYQEAASAGIELYLCGHTHAGQIRLPLIGAVKKNAPVPREMVQGPWTYKKLRGYTSWGAGCSTLPIRFNCAPDVALLELRRLAGAALP